MVRPLVEYKRVERKSGARVVKKRRAEDMELVALVKVMPEAVVDFVKRMTPNKNEINTDYIDVVLKQLWN